MKKRKLKKKEIKAIRRLDWKAEFRRWSINKPGEHWDGSTLEKITITGDDEDLYILFELLCDLGHKEDDEEF